jgi:hypothetical protein
MTTLLVSNHIRVCVCVCVVGYVCLLLPLQLCLFAQTEYRVEVHTSVIYYDLRGTANLGFA